MVKEAQLGHVFRCDQRAARSSFYPSASIRNHANAQSYVDNYPSDIITIGPVLLA